jgi:hypothetical protein
LVISVVLVPVALGSGQRKPTTCKRGSMDHALNQDWAMGMSRPNRVCQSANKLLRQSIGLQSAELQALAETV